MKSSRGIVWGGLLVILGIYWLLRNMNLINIQWDAIAPYWPVLLILAGAILLVSRRESGIPGGVVALLITLAVFGGITNRADRAFNRHDNDWNFNWGDNDDDDEDDHDRSDEDSNDDNDEDDNDDEDKDEDYQKEHSNMGGNKPVNGSYKYEMEDFIQKANFNLEGGAGSFTMKGNTAKLFEANTHSSLVGFISNTSINKLENSATVNLKMEEGNVKLKNGEISNEAKIQLNENPVWNIDLGIGAGKGDFDFSNYKVEKLKVSTGVADMEIRMGDKMTNADVDIEAGVASITLKIPSSVGCEMRMDGALNSKSFDDLEKVGEGLYRSPNFNQATKKIIVRYEGGLTSFKIERY